MLCHLHGFKLPGTREAGKVTMGIIVVAAGGDEQKQKHAAGWALRLVALAEIAPPRGGGGARSESATGSRGTGGPEPRAKARRASLSGGLANRAGHAGPALSQPKPPSRRCRLARTVTAVLSSPSPPAVAARRGTRRRPGPGRRARGRAGRRAALGRAATRGGRRVPEVGPRSPPAQGAQALGWCGHGNCAAASLSESHSSSA
jgi:hypothetical protein